jgi:hypothetical protein
VSWDVSHGLERDPRTKPWGSESKLGGAFAARLRQEAEGP